MPRGKQKTQNSTRLDIQPLPDSSRMQEPASPDDSHIRILNVENNEDTGRDSSDHEKTEPDHEQQEQDEDTGGKQESKDPKPDIADKDTDDDHHDHDEQDDQDDSIDDGKTFNGVQMKAILERKTKQLNSRISELEMKLEEAEKKISEAEENGKTKGIIEQKKNEIAKRYGFDKDILPDTEKGLDEFDKHMAKYEKGHEKRSIPIAPVKHEEFKLPWIKSIS